MGRGGGRGLGRGGVPAEPAPAAYPQSAPQPETDASQEIAALKAQAHAVAEQLAALNAQISRIGEEATTRRLVAVVDTERCTACGLCVEVCAAGAITVDAVAAIDAGRCTACGQCVTECPQGAVSLRSA